LNLYAFSQVNNSEMGILIRRSDDSDLYRDAYEEAQRIIRISEEVRISLERVASPEDPATDDQEQDAAGDGEKLATSKLSRKLGLKTADLIAQLTAVGLLELHAENHYLTETGKAAGGEFRKSARFGAYFLWPATLKS
jgi:hypothetical protein